MSTANAGAAIVADMKPAPEYAARCASNRESREADRAELLALIHEGRRDGLSHERIGALLGYSAAGIRKIETAANSKPE